MLTLGFAEDVEAVDAVYPPIRVLRAPPAGPGLVHDREGGAVQGPAHPAAHHLEVAGRQCPAVPDSCHELLKNLGAECVSFVCRV